MRNLLKHLNKFFEPVELSGPGRYLSGLAGLTLLLAVVSATWRLSGQPVMLWQPPLLGNQLNLSGFFAAGPQALDCLLVVAALLLAYPFFAAPAEGQAAPGPGQFYRQWFGRLAPLYYGTLLIMLLFYTASLIAPAGVFSRDGVLRLAAHLTLTQGFWPFSFDSWAINPFFGVVSSLALFTLLLPWLVRLFYGRCWPFGLAFLLALHLGWLILSRAVAAPGGDLYRYLTAQFPVYLADFGSGLALARLLAHPRPVISRRTAWLYFGLGVALLVYSLNKINTDPTPLFSYYLSRLPVALGFSLLIAGIGLGRGWLEAFFSWSPLRWLGALALPVYLWHTPVLYAIQQFADVKVLPVADRFPQMLLYETIIMAVLGLIFFTVLLRPRFVPRPQQVDARQVEQPALKGYRGFEQRVLKIFLVNPSSGQNVPYLDGVRAIAVMLVIFTHTWELTGSPRLAPTIPLLNFSLDLTSFFRRGFIGVQLFFVLSGLLLAQSWLRADFLGRPRPSLGQYYRQRFLRLAPAYYICFALLLTLTVPAILPAQAVFSGSGALSAGIHLAFMQSAFPVSAGSWLIGGVVWTLTIEAIFYLILPWFVRAFTGNRWLVSLPVCLAISLAWSYLSFKVPGAPVISWLEEFWRTPDGLRPTQVAELFPSHLFNLGIGITLANLYLRRQLRPAPRGWHRWFFHRYTGAAYFWGGGLLLVVTLLFIMRVNHVYENKLVTASLCPLAFTLIIAGLMWGGGWPRRFFSFLPIRYIGITGYSIFLLHMPIIYLILRYPAVAALEPLSRFKAVFSLDIVVAFLLATAFYLLIEKPFMLLSKKRPVLAESTGPSVVPAPLPAETLTPTN